MNNKGMTIVELIVTFSLLLVLVVGMFNLVMDVKFDLDSKQITKDFTEYSSTMNHQIQYDLITNDVKMISYKNSSTDSVSCPIYSGANACPGNTNFGTLCNNIYPCLIYNDGNNNKAIALNTDLSNYSKYGIYYDNVFEPLPNQDYVYFDSGNPPTINYNDSSKLLTIDFPYYMVDNEKNYGFKIVVPFGE